MRSPSELPRRVLAFGDDFGMFPAGSTILCALSGGADSMALLTCLQELAEERGLTLQAAHYNHQLRGEESQRDEAFVTNWCAGQGIPLSVGTGNVAEESARTGKGIEETARAMRYAFLDETARQTGADAIATAHNADDNTETVLLHLVRGTGLDGLSGIPPRRGKLIRPLLNTSRGAIEAYLAEKGIPHVEDSSNGDTAYARNRLRQEVMPVLRSLNPHVSETLAANLRHIRADRDYLESLAAEPLRQMQKETDGLSLSAHTLTSLPTPVAVRAVKQLLAELGRYQVSAVHLEQILSLAAGKSPSARIHLPDSLTVRREYDRLRFSLTPETPTDFPPVTLPGPGTLPVYSRWTVSAEEAICPEHPAQTPWEFWLRREAAGFPLTIRPRQTGDRLRLPGRKKKPLKKWYIDEKIPREERDVLPVLIGHAGLLAAAGLGPEETLTAIPGEPALHVTVIPIQKEHTGKE